jgi:hypothetical protein
MVASASGSPAAASAKKAATASRRHVATTSLTIGVLCHCTVKAGQLDGLLYGEISKLWSRNGGEANYRSADRYTTLLCRLVRYWLVPVVPFFSTSHFFSWVMYFFSKGNVI